jgi:hypothetical protein
MQKKAPLRKKWGAVAVIDALGAAKHDVAQAIGFVEQRDRILKTLKTVFKEKAPELQLPSNYQQHVFGDTVVFSWALNREAADFGRLLYGVSLFLGVLVAKSLEKSVAWRGALSLGEYVSNASTILGPALADAAAWYADAEWMGILATPRATIYMLQYASDLAFSCVEYEVPLKGDACKLLAINWPLFYLAGEDPRCAFLKDLAHFPIPKGTEKKYQNSILFFDARPKDHS